MRNHKRRPPEMTAPAKKPENTCPMCHGVLDMEWCIPKGETDVRWICSKCYKPYAKNR